MSALASATLVLLPVTVAAGLDLYLTLFFLGAAPYLGWETPLPGGLGRLGVLPVLAMVAALYLAELLADRVPLLTLPWNAVNTLIRPVAAGLLGLLVFHDVGGGWAVAAAVVAAGLALVIQVARTGWTLVLGLARVRRRTRILASGAEDVTALALVSLALETPWLGAFLAVVVLALGVRWIEPYLVGGLFGHRLLWARTWGALDPRGWREGTDLPSWIHDALAEGSRGHGVLRGVPAGGLALPSSPLFVSGWLVPVAGAPLFLQSGRQEGRVLDLGSAHPRRIESGPYHDRVELTTAAGDLCALCVPTNGPGPAGLEVAFPLRSEGGEPR